MKKLKYIIYFILTFIGAVIWGLAVWASFNFEVNVGAIINTLLTPLEGAGNDTVMSALLACLPWVLAALISMMGFVWLDKHRASSSKKITAGFLSGAVMLIVSALIFIQCKYDLIGYYQRIHANTNLYAERYVDPREVNITAPDEKRNLIYIYLESMETTYADKGNGGRQKQNYIENLTELAKNNISFSPTDSLGGFQTCEGADWTMGALFATSSGVPFEFPVGDNSMNLQQQFASGIYTMGDFLEDQGYRQMFLCGSDGMFAGRKTFYEQHGSYDVYDYYRAITEGEIAPDYKVWWGFEDEKLYEIAKKELTKLASQKEPFNFTMLTVDTHFKGGYICRLCEDDYKSDAANVVACADRQIAEFVGWIQKQDFYDNTTIVITGDHPRMDKMLVKNTAFADRLIYNCYLNTVYDKEDVNQIRQSTGLDVFPTVLSAMGYEIEGDRLGLGTNLFSDEKTLVDEMGIDDLNLELMKTSKYYIEHFAPELAYLIEDEFDALQVVYFYGRDYNAEQFVTSPFQMIKDEYWVTDQFEVDIPLEHGDGEVTIKLHIKGTYNGEQTLQMMEDEQVVYEETISGNTVVPLTGYVKDGHCRFSLYMPDAASPHDLNPNREDDVKRSFSIDSITINERE